MATLIVSAGTVSSATGQAMQNHIIYAECAANWWLFYIESGATTTLKTKYSSDFITWTDGASMTLVNDHLNEGRNFSVAYKNIGGYDVVHIATIYNVSGTSRWNYHIRARIFGTTIIFGSEDVVDGEDTTNYDTDLLGPNLGYDSNNKIVVIDDITNSVAPSAKRSTNADNGLAW